MTTNRYCHISCLGNPRDSQLPRELPQQGQVQLEDQGSRQRGGAHLVRDLWSSQGRFLEGENFVCTNMILILWLQIKGVTAKLYGSYENGFGEILPATSEARTLKVQFRSNKKKNAGGFRCQVSLQWGSASSMTSSDRRCCSSYRVWIWSCGWHWFWVTHEIKILGKTNNSYICKLIEIKINWFKRPQCPWTCCHCCPRNLPGDLNPWIHC